MHLTVIFLIVLYIILVRLTLPGRIFFPLACKQGDGVDLVWSRWKLVSFFFSQRLFFFSHLANLPGGCVAERVVRDACGRWMCRQQVWLLGTPVWTRSSLRCTICSPRVGKWWLLPAGLLARKNFPTGPHQRRQLILSKILLPKKFSPNYYF